MRTVLLSVLVLLLAGCYSKQEGVRIESDHLRVRSAYFDERISFDQLDLTAARVVSVHKGAPHYPETRGIGNSATRQGVYTLANGERALSLVSGASALLIPAGRRRVLLISTAEYPTLLDDLKAAKQAFRER